MILVKKIGTKLYFYDFNIFNKNRQMNLEFQSSSTIPIAINFSHPSPPIYKILFTKYIFSI